jgi:hypothetical protein
MHKVMNETTLRMRGLISRRMFTGQHRGAVSEAAPTHHLRICNGRCRSAVERPRLFGYLPKFGGTPELLNADTRGASRVSCGTYAVELRGTPSSLAELG